MFSPEFYDSRSQDLENSFHDAGQFYWGNTNAFINKPKIFSEISTPFIVPSYLVQDIDTEEDWTRAELMYEALKKTGKLI